MPSARDDAGGRPIRAGERAALVHGYLANTFMLAVLGRRLRDHGFTTSTWGYWNIRCSVLVHAERFARELQVLDADPRIDRLHLVTHSMGGIIARAALARYRPKKLGRFVMLAPPNRGSFVATAAASTVGRVLKPVAELSTSGTSLVNSLPMPEGVDIGVIAAEYDALIDADSTRPDVPHEHVTLSTWHTGILFRRETADLAAAFLSSGRFPAEAVPAGEAR